MKVELTITKEFDVKYLSAACNVRYWEDTDVDGVADTDGSLIPCRSGDMWGPVINLETGQITNWDKGITAKVHYKVVDEGVYTLLDEKHEEIVEIDGYVPKIMCPGGDGYGDYVIMNIDSEGYIENWKVDFTAFED